MDKFVVRPPKQNNEGYKGVMIRADTHEMIVQLKNECGISITEFIDQMVKFCAPRIVIGGAEE